MDFDTEKFIYEVEKRPCLWNLKCTEYSDRIKKIQGWEEIVIIFGGTDLSMEEKKTLGRIDAWVDMMNVADKRMLEREALRNMIQQWNANRLDLFELSEPNENLEFHGVMRFYFQDSGQKIATKCIRVASDATVSDVIETLIEKFRPDMRMLSLPSYALYEVLATHEERRLSQNEKPLLVQLNWHADDREGRFLLKCVDQSELPTNNNASDTSNQNFKRKLSKREKKELKKKEKISRMKSDATNEEEKAVAEKLYTELPETSFTRSISNPEAVMRRRRHQKLERKLQQFRSKDGGPDTGGTLKIYGESLCPDVPYKTLLLSVGDCAAHVVREMLEKYGLGKNDPQQFCLMQVNADDNTEYVLDDDDCPLAIVMTHPHRGSIMFHVRRRPADCQPRRRKKKSVGGGGGGPVSAAAVHHAHHHHPPRDTPFLVEVTPDGAVLEGARQLRLTNDVIEVGSGNGMTLQLYGPSIQPRHCVVAPGGTEGVATLTPLHADAELYVNGQRVYHTAVLQHGCLIKFGRVSTFRFVDPAHENRLSRNLSQSQHFDSGSIYDRSPTSPIPDNASGIMSSQSINNHQLDGMHSPSEAGMANSTGNVDFPRAMSPLAHHKMGSQDNFNYGSKSHIDLTDSMSPYNNNNNSLKMDDESPLMSQHFANSKSDLLQDNHFASPYNEHEQQTLSKSGSGSGGLKDNYETTFDLDGNVETKSICSAKSGGSGHEPRSSQQMAPRGQEAILPAVLEFPEVGQQQFLHAVITRLDVNVPAFKLAPVYTLYLCARYRASTHYRPELSPTERAHKLTALLHHVATLIQNVIQERQAEASWQAFWMANGSELLHFLKCDRHIAAFSLQAQEALALAVHGAFANLVGCLQAELAPRLGPFLAPRLGPFLAGERDDEAVSPAVHVLAGAMALLRRCRLNAALTIQLFSHLFHYINAYCYNKLVTTPAMCTARWGTLTASRLSQLAGWAEIQGLELAADCHLARLQQVAHLLQAPKNTPDDIAAITSTCFKLNSVQLHQLMSSFVFENGSPVRPELVELAVQHAMSVADELYKADGREITLEESTDLGVQLLVPGDGYSGDVVRGVPPALQDFIAPLQRARLCRLTMQPHSRGAWTVYMNGYHGGSMSMKPSSQQPVVQVIQLHKNTNGMGLSIVAAKGAGQSRLGIYIKSVVSGGAAAADGRLQAGDQLLSVDGQSLQGITQEKAAEFLVRTGPVVTLEVAKQGAVLHGLATLLQQPSPQTNREEEESIRRHSGTFTNFSPVFLRKTRPESEMVTTYHDSAYAKGLGIPDRHSAYYSQQPGFSASVPNSQSFSYLNEETCSSDDSLNNPSRYVGSIPRLTISLDRENTFYEEESPETPGIDIDCHDDDMPRRITVSNLPVFTFICEDFDDMKAKEEEKRKLENSHREQSVDSSLYSYDSDSCANYSQYSINTETKVENPLPKVEFDVSQNQEMCNSFEKLDINLPEQFNSIEICRCTDDEGEIPFIDDGDLEPLIYEHKSCSEDDICEKAVSKVRQILPAVSIEKPDEEPVFKDVATNVTPDSLTLAESEAKPTNSNGQDHFLGEAPKDQNFFSDDSSNRGPTNDKTYYGKITYEKGTKEYVIGPKKGLSLALNQKSETKSSSSREILDSNLNKSWKSPDDIRLGSGKVKALASHFNKMNLQYRAGSYKRNCQSSPNLYHPVINEKKNDAISTSMANLAFLSAPPKLSELEQKKILIQLEDWSRHGTRSSLDSLTIEEQLRSEMPKEIITITQSSSLIFKEIEVTSPSKITLDDIKINWVPHRETDENFTIPKKYGSLEKLTGSLVPRVVEMIPRKAVSSNDIEKSARKPAIEKTKLKIPRRKFPDSYVVKKKTKPRISTKSENTQDSENTLPYPDMSVVQSCPNLLKNTSIRRNNCLIGSNVNHSCPNIVRNRSELSYMKVCPLGGSKCEAATPRFAWIQYGPVQIGIRSRSVDEISARRASERDLPSRLESESGAMQVKPSKSVPALHEQTRQHEVFNPGYSRTSSNNSIPTMAGLKSRSSHNLSAPLSPGVQPNIHPHAHHHHNQQNAGVEQGFYQNIFTYKNPPTQQQQLGDRFSNLRSSQNGLQLQGLQNLPPKQSPMQASPSLQMPPNLGQQHSNTLGPQRPQSAYYQQGQTSTIPPTNGMRSAQSSKDLPGSYDGPNQVRGSYPSMPNVNQGFAPNGPQYHQNHYPSGASSQGNVNYNRPPQHAGQSSFRGQAKLAEMSEEVTRRQQRGPMSPGEAQANQNNRFQYSADSYNRLSNGPLSPNAIQNSPTKQQPPVAPKPSGPKRVISGDMAALESDGPPLPPTNTHPQFHTPNTDEDGAYLASALDPPALSVYPAHHSHPHSNQQRAPPGTAPNPWQREEREKEAMARRAAGRARRDAALAALVALGNSRSPLQTQQLRALQLERDFERRAATEMSNDNNEDKEQQDQQGPPLSPMNGGGLLRLANTNNQQHNMNHQMGHMSQSVSMQQLEAAAGINLVPVSSNVVSSIQPVSIVTSNINGGDQQPDSPAGQQTPVPNYPPPPPPTQPKSILKSNLRLENLNSNSPQSPSKSHKNASFSSNLTPQSLKFDQMQPDKYEQSSPNKFEQNMLSKYDPNVPKYAEQQTPTLSKYEQNSYSSSVQNLSKYDPNISVNQLSQNISSLNVSNHERHSGEMEMRYEEQPQGYAPFDPQPALPPQPPERGSSFAVMSQAQQLRSNLLSPNASQALANSLRDKRVSFHDRDQNAASSVEQTNNESNMEIIREDPDRFIAEAENMLQSPTTPTGASATHTPGVIGAQEVYRDPRQRRLLAEQQQKQAQNSPIPEKLTFQEKMKMFALESGENNTPKDKVKISRAQRDIDAVH